MNALPMSELAERLEAAANTATLQNFYADIHRDVSVATDLRLAASRLREMEWRSIDSAPKDGTCVLLWMVPVPDPRWMPADGPTTVIGYYVVWSESLKRQGMKDGWSWHGPVRCEPTHWMPLPPPPEPQP